MLTMKVKIALGLVALYLLSKGKKQPAAPAAPASPDEGLTPGYDFSDDPDTFTLTQPATETFYSGGVRAPQTAPR